MLEEATEHVGEAIKLNADQLISALDAMSDAVAHSDGRESSTHDAGQVLAWWDRFIQNQSRIGAYLKLVKVLLDENGERDKWYNRLDRHGVRSHHVKQQSDEAVAITSDLGSGLIGHSQKMTVAARAMAEKKTVGHRS